jgi:hypothetical protein
LVAVAGELALQLTELVELAAEETAAPLVHQILAVAVAVALKVVLE